MKKIMVILGVLAVVLFASICYFFNYDYDNNTYISSNSNKKNILKEESLSMLLETEEGSGEYEIATQSDWPTEDYIFNETLSRCEYGGKLIWDDNEKKVLFDGNSKDRCYIYFDKNTGLTLANYVISQYNGIQGNNNIYYHNGSLTNGLSDNSYRYAGASDSVNNYVCISDETTCSDANLFRIKGLFDESVKLIKATSLGSYVWDSSGSNTWSAATLNTYLNGEYLTSLGDFATNYIATKTWIVGGNLLSNIVNAVPTTAYKNEITSPAATTTVSKKIGLMYVTDYAYAAAYGSWDTVLNSYNNVAANDWLYLGKYEWTITPRSDFAGRVFAINSRAYSYDLTNSIAVRPTFYLNEKVLYKSGSGLSTDPIRLVL